MSDATPADLHFLNDLNAIIAKNLGDEHFGVTELADAMNMSRSNLLRKVKKSTDLPVNQLIREARLKKAMELLQNSASNISEISHQVGFNSTSYFIKCFREYYGYPPGEAGKRTASEIATPILQEKTPARNLRFIIGAGIAVILVISGIVALYYYNRAPKVPVQRSIVVLPFKNESNDSTNIYLINGLMESTLSNLQKIENLRVLSRTSAEKYRNTSKSIVEMAHELDAQYFVEGSGQKMGDEILLNIQLIEGRTDKHLWAKQYRRQAKDIFSLQQEIAQNIASEVEVVITPEARMYLEKIPTNNLEAYDLYLKGKEFFYEATPNNLPKAMACFRKAVVLDNRFGLAYAHLVMVEYYLDIFRIEKTYTAEMNAYADKAMLFDPKSAESLIAKGLSYAQLKQYKSAVQYLEKALEYNHHAALVYHFLIEFYSLFVPDPEKYLVYALHAAKEERATMDSATVGFRYFHLANALVQAGFIDEGVRYVDYSLKYDPNSFFAGYIGILFHFAQDRNIKVGKQRLEKELQKDTTRADILKELARICYMQRDNKEAYRYYKSFIARRDALHFEIYQEDNITISAVLNNAGKKEEAQKYLATFKRFADNDSSIYKHLHLTLYYAQIGDTKSALSELKLFSKENNYMFWILLLANDPSVDSLRDLPEFKKLMKEIDKKFWDRKDRIKDDLKRDGMWPLEDYLGR